MIRPSIKSLCRTLPIAAFVVAVSACQSDSDDSVVQKDGYVTMNFNITNYEQYSLDDVSSVGGTRASGDVSALAHLALGVFDSDGNSFTSVLQNKNESGYGSFTLSLPYGNYTFVFLGYDGSHLVELNSPTNITFADGYVPNCFLKTLTFTIDDTTTSNEQITLSRCVGCFTVRCSKGIPKEMKAMNYTAQGGGTALNALTGYAATTSVRTGSVDFSNVASRLEEQVMNIYSFLPSEQASMQFTLSAVKGDGSAIRTRTFADVPMKINTRVTYSGDFFADNSKFQLGLANNEWNVVDYTY